VKAVSHAGAALRVLAAAPWRAPVGGVAWGEAGARGCSARWSRQRRRAYGSGVSDSHGVQTRLSTRISVVK